MSVGLDRELSHSLGRADRTGTLGSQVRGCLIRRVFVRGRCDGWNSRGGM